MSVFTFRCGCWLVVLAAVTGCSRGSSGKLPETYKVTGLVTFDDQPLVDAMVQFQLDDGKHGAVGLTDETGRYRLTTFHSHDGAVPGQYKVAVTKFSKPPADFPERQSEDDLNAPQFKSENLLPPKYASTETSGLLATVSEAENQIDFVLDKNVK